jgi:GTP-binding protein
VANYPFTTLDPNLGSYYGLILADIPGLIEGASLGKGLGIKFLRHIERTKTIFHFISAESADPLEDYKVIRKELETHNKELLSKPEYVILTKTDLLSEEDVKKKVALLEKTGKKVLPVSIIDEKSLKKVEEVLREIIKQKESV